MSQEEMATRILEHFAKGGTLVDPKIVELYREAHKLAAGAETDPLAVTTWAIETAKTRKLGGIK